MATLAVGGAEAAGKVALVIGNAAYQHTRVLSNPKNDAEAVAKLLRDIGFAPGDVTLKTDLGHREMLGVIRAFIDKAAGADTVIVYYAGHGIEVGGENYLVPVDAKLARDVDLEYEAITLASVLKAVGGARKLKLVILDACRTNPQADKIALRGQAKRSTSRGLERIEPGGDVLVAYAAKHGTAALDGKGTHSPYAEALLKHMATPGLDVLRMLGRVKETVLTTTGNQQEPWFYGSPGGETLSLMPAKVGVAPPVVPPVSGALTPEAAVRICREVEAMSSLTVLGALTDQHKGTVAGQCIAARIEELEKQPVARPKAPDKEVAVALPKDSAPVPATECDRLAAHPDAAPPGVKGVFLEALDASRAIAACQGAVARYPDQTRFQVWLGRALEKSKSYAEALSWYEKAVEKGSATAMRNLGYMYEQGRSVPQSYATARSWYEKGAALGDAGAMNNLGLMYEMGNGVPQSYATARSWYERAAALGNAVAMSNLGVMYRRGKGVPQSYAMARSWYEKAAALGDEGAMNNLGSLYAEGLGVPRDYATARHWFEKAVALGTPIAMHNLAILLDAGRGGARSPQGAARHLLAAARGGYGDARQDLDGSMSQWSANTRRAVQQLLRDAGDYFGAVNGQWGPSSRNAGKAYYMRKE